MEPRVKEIAPHMFDLDIDCQKALLLNFYDLATACGCLT
jgi:hypothetical protein